jgi:cobalt-zinc-cadmium efflux system outer membrane protein
VEQAVHAAVQSNPRLGAAVRDLAAARQGARGAAALANPLFVFTPALTDGGSDTELLIQQSLELNGTRAARKGAAQARERGAEADAITEMRSLVCTTRSAYYELVRARERASLARGLLQTSEELDRLTRRQVEEGSRPAVEQTQADIEVTRARQQVTLAEAAVTAREVALNTLLNRPPDSPVGAVGFDAAPAVPTPPLPTVEEALRRAFSERADLEAEAAGAEAFRQEARLARAEGVPDLAPQYRATSITRGGVQDAGFGLGITLPLLDYGSRRARVRQAEESARAEEGRLEATRALVRQEVVSALAQARAAETVLAAYPQGLLDDSKRLLDASRLGYEAGKTSIVSLLEAQRTYRQVQSEFIDAQVAAALARADLERATGAFLARLLPETPAATAPLGARPRTP